MRILVVGAGFAGAVYARVLAEHGHSVTVIDRRDHIAGNAFDYVDPCGIRIHRYGPHLFHTNNEHVVTWLTRFGKLIPYEHSVSVKDADRFHPLPISRATFESFYDRRFDSDADFQSFKDQIVDKGVVARNAAEYLHSVVGRDLTELIFRPYTQKMWGQSLEETDVSVVKRLTVHNGYEKRYFPNDKYQYLPSEGYTAIFSRIFDHENITVRLSTGFERPMLDAFEHTFSSAAIDDFFDYRLGELPYRSIRFHHVVSEGDEADAPTPVVNYSDSGPFTRESHWHMLPNHRVKVGDFRVKTIEEPCDYRLNDFERYYPIADAAGKNQQRYDDYKDLAAKEPHLTFIGRCGTYKYLDMHQVINQSLVGASHWLSVNPT